MFIDTAFCTYCYWIPFVNYLTIQRKLHSWTTAIPIISCHPVCFQSVSFFSHIISVSWSIDGGFLDNLWCKINYRNIQALDAWYIVIYLCGSPQIKGDYIEVIYTMLLIHLSDDAYLPCIQELIILLLIFDATCSRVTIFRTEGVHLWIANNFKCNHIWSYNNTFCLSHAFKWDISPDWPSLVVAQTGIGG